MLYNIDDRLNRLRVRRMDSQNSVMLEKGFTEAFEKRSNDKATRYALGAMQQVDERSTAISLEEADKVERNLREGLDAESLYPNFKLQGSVPLNVHIRGVSDVDLLVIEGRFLRYDANGNKSSTYLPYTGKGELVDDILHLRRKSEIVLEKRFWAAKVDKSNAKSIQLSEGSFRRKVDVVPACWYDTVSYQASNKIADRGVEIANKFTRETIRNFPFLYIAEINAKALETNNGAKMAIRLCKNIKSDSTEEIALSSYDIGSLIYHCPSGDIRHALARDLLILSGTEKWFAQLASNRSAAESYLTPDRTRKIIDSKEKWDGLIALSKELSHLAAEVQFEIASPLFKSNSDKESLRKILNEAVVPA